MEELKKLEKCKYCLCKDTAKRIDLEAEMKN